MFKPVLQFSVLALLSVSLTSCLFGQHGLIHDRSNDYLTSPNQLALDVPRTIPLVDSDAAYPIPQGPTITDRKVPVSIVPPGFNTTQVTLSSGSTSEKISLVTGEQGNLHLQVIQSDYATVWAQTTEAIKKIKYSIIGSDKENGVFEISGRSKKNVGAEVYQLKVVKSPSAVSISVLSQTGEHLDNATVQAILKELEQKMRVG